jgi:hypothetical protein
MDDFYNPFTEEKIRGMGTSVISAITGNGLNAIAHTVYGMNPLLSTFLCLYVLGSFLGYALDIVFAKKAFDGQEVSYLDIMHRLKWLGRSFVTTTFLKFIITAIIDVIIGIEMLKLTLNLLDKYNIKFKFRNEIAAAIVSFVAFILWVNALRFNWAYSDEQNVTLDIIVIVWLSLAILIYCAIHNIQSNRDDDKPQKTMELVNPDTNLPPFTMYSSI